MDSMNGPSTARCAALVLAVFYMTRGLVSCIHVIQATGGIRSISGISLSSSIVSERQSRSECYDIESNPQDGGIVLNQEA